MRGRLSGWHPMPRVFGPKRGRAFAGALSIGAAGGGFFVGWGLVRSTGDPRTGVSEQRLPAPDWLPIAGTAHVAVAFIALLITYLSAPVSTGGQVPEHLKRPAATGSRGLVACLLVPFDLAMIVCAAASSESSDRWEPLWVALVLTIVVPIGVPWAMRSQGW